MFDLDGDGVADAMIIGKDGNSRPMILVEDRLVETEEQYAIRGFRWSLGRAKWVWVDGRKGIYEFTKGKWVARGPATFKQE